MAATTPIRNIAIVGATGQVGSHITAALLRNKSFTITALTRPTSTAPPTPGTTTIPVDYTSLPSLTAALKNQDALIITLAVRAPPSTQATLIRAAAAAHVPWILPNEFGSGTQDPKIMEETGFGPRKQLDRELIEELGVSSWIGIATGFWYEYSLSGPGLYGIDIAKREVVFFDEGVQRLNTSTWAQVGRAVAGLLALPGGPGGEEGPTLSVYRNRFVRVSSFAVNQREMLDSLNRVMGLRDADWSITRVGTKKRWEEAKKMLAEGNGIGLLYMMYTRNFFPGENAGLYEVTEGLDNEKLALPKEDLDEATKEAVRMAGEGYFANLGYDQEDFEHSRYTV